MCGLRSFSPATRHTGRAHQALGDAHLFHVLLERVLQMLAEILEVPGVFRHVGLQITLAFADRLERRTCVGIERLRDKLVDWPQ